MSTVEKIKDFLSRKQRTPENEPRHLGTVKFFNTTKNYGFISPDDGTRDVFITGVDFPSYDFSPLEKGGARITYTLTEGGKHSGPKVATFGIIVSSNQ